jgi:F-type H+-transporting ATPase subunit delta
MAVAQRMYARALFEAGREEGRIDAVAADLAALAGAIEEVPELRALLRNPEVDPPEKASLLDQLTEGAGELVEMNAELEGLVAREQNRLAVDLTTAYELSDDEARSIVDKIERASGRTVEATRSVDPGLIGGIVLRVGSFLADGSVRGRLDRLRQELATR